MPLLGGFVLTIGPPPPGIGKLGLVFIFPLALAVFALQVAFSTLWLARFRFGPVEWLWRSLTYGRAQPMRIAAPAN